jgi:hypothetical protein
VISLAHSLFENKVPNFALSPYGNRDNGPPAIASAYSANGEVNGDALEANACLNAANSGRTAGARIAGIVFR